MNQLKTILLLAALTIVTGCNHDNELAVLKRRSVLSQLGIGYQAYQAQYGKSPSDAKQLGEFLLAEGAGDPHIESAVESLNNGDIVMIWNGLTSDGKNLSGKNLDNDLLGFESSVPRGGGYIVTGGASVQLVTVKQFSEMPTIPVSESEPQMPGK